MVNKGLFGENLAEDIFADTWLYEDFWHKTSASLFDHNFVYLYILVHSLKVWDRIFIRFSLSYPG